MIEGTPWSEQSEILSLSKKPIGQELAQRVADKLTSSSRRQYIANRHRDYCGHGLVFQDDTIRLVEVHDGSVSDATIIKQWSSSEVFVAWLANQSDFSLSGADSQEPDLYTDNRWTLNNQRLTQSRLEQFTA